MLKQISSHQLMTHAPAGTFWQTRYYDFNVWSEHKLIEKLRYMHRNPVKRGLVENPEHWEKTGSGVAFVTTCPESTAQSKSSLTGPHEEENNLA